MNSRDRRTFLQATTTLGLATIMPGLGVARAEGSYKVLAEEVSAAEDLMREHGVLNRVLLIYEEGLRRMGAGEELPAEVFQTTATLVRKFVEDYHERLEENYLFTEFEKQGKLVDLVTVLRKQHEAGRQLTDVVLREAVDDRLRQEEHRNRMQVAIEAFIRMYRPHEAREDTVLFPALPEVFSVDRLEELGEQFEEEEDRLFGEGGFQKTVEKVATIEKQLGIYDLAQFTPVIPAER